MTADEDKPTGPKSPPRASAAKRQSLNATPIRKASAPDGGATPKSAPAAGATRRRAATTKPQPTLLGDFLRGKPSPARVAADRAKAKQRRMSLEQVKFEMRQESVRKVQAPGGVRDRVKQWQKNNAAAMAAADPLATPSEPSEMNIQVDSESVTEEDRVRIKMRQKKKPPDKPPGKVMATEEKAKDGEGADKENQGHPRPNSPPKKRVVSDTNWMKNKKRSPPNGRSPKIKPDSSHGSPLPKDFLARHAANPTVKNKIKDWAARVEPPDEPPIRHVRASKSMGAGDGIRVRAMQAGQEDAAQRSSRSEDHDVIHKASKPHKPKSVDGDGIRVKAVRKKVSREDSIRVRPQKGKLTPLDDGIRVYAEEAKPSDDATTIRASSRQESQAPSTRIASTHHEVPPSERIPAIEESESDAPATPTRKSSGKQPSRMRQGAAPSRRTETETMITEEVSDSESWTSESGASESGSDKPSSIPSKLAEIPVGYSAFSELDLPHGAHRSKRPTANTRSSSFKGATKVFKKALNEGKKILSEKAEHPPRPAASQPRSIESWLDKTVDPFVEVSAEVASTPPSAAESKEKSPLPKKQSLENVSVGESKGRHSSSSTKKNSSEAIQSNVPSKREESSTKDSETHEEPHAPIQPDAPKDLNEYQERLTGERPRVNTKTPPSSGLKRHGATRSASSPVKLAAKKGFKDRLKDAFKGESNAPRYPPATYPSGSDELLVEPERDDEPREHHSSSFRKSPSPPDTKSPSSSDRTKSEQIKSESPIVSPKRRPPTNGFHELSTIASEASHSTLESDLSSMLSETTVTRSTTLTSSTGTEVSRKRSNNSGLKRRLTKHSDLVSVLSLPDDGAAPTRSSSLRSARSLRRTSNHLENATVEDLLREVAQDENLYQRELKTLVDGVIPVLLTKVVHSDHSHGQDFFASPSTQQKDKESSLGRSVVQMGIALEKLKSAHKRCPLSDAHRLPQWLESIQCIYDNYLDVWRLGFQGVIVNLAPLSADDEDSLIGALPRNEEGDVLNEDGERIDVAHLLRRPLVRIKWINKFIKGYRTVTGTSEYEKLAADWDALQDKARRRHKEELARVIDEDAANTDTSRVRDLKTLEALDNVKIDRFRQVYAKDMFALELCHSNGQRLECQVELISRDNQLFKSDPGDLLIRETGSRGRSWLLFAPVTGGHYSARKGDQKGQLVVMIRGFQDAWFQLLTLTTDCDEQIEEWLDILGTCPEPPAVHREPSVKQPSAHNEDAPLGERRRRQATSRRQSPVRPTTPSRPHSRDTSFSSPPPSSPRSSTTPQSTKTVTQNSYERTRDDDRSKPLREDMRPDPLTLHGSPSRSAEDHEDAPPPPPAHGSVPPKKSTLSPPVELGPSRMKRRTSSPLKHECHPSDISSDESTELSASETEDDSEPDSSDDELEAADMPDTMPAISIKEPVESPTQSLLSDSHVSLTPSASASQANLQIFGGKRAEYAIKSIATISYWDNKKGCWKELWPEVCSIITTPGLIEAYPLKRTQSKSGEDEPPLIALDLTPLVMLRNSTVLDLEIRSPVLSYARLYSKVTKIETSYFRFRTTSFQDSEDLYMAVHRARMDNAKYKALEEEARVRAFGQNQTTETDGDNSSRRRSWFGRKSSYRASTRAPSQTLRSSSHSSALSASSFLKKLIGSNQSFDIASSSVDRQSHSGSGSGGGSLYSTSLSSGAPRSPSVSTAATTARMSLATNNLKIRLHLLVSASKWEDHGNCLLEITRPDQGTRQNLRKYQGMEKRIIVTTYFKKVDKNKDKAVVKLDVVLGSRCFSRLGSRGILLNVWEEVRDERGESGVVPRDGTSGGMVNKWCFQCASVAEANWIYGLVTQEVVIG